MMDDERCRSDILGRSALDLRDDGLGYCSDSEELEAVDEELDMVGERDGRGSRSRSDMRMELG